MMMGDAIFLFRLFCLQSVQGCPELPRVSGIVEVA